MARLGTPENPEVIEPGTKPRSSTASPPRLIGAARLLAALAVVTGPAAALDWITLWLFREGWRATDPVGTAFAWALSLLVIPAAAVATCIALIGAPFILLSIVFLLSGRPIAIQRFGQRR